MVVVVAVLAASVAGAVRPLAVPVVVVAAVELLVAATADSRRETRGHEQQLQL